MTIADQTKVRERTNSASATRTAIESSLSIKNTNLSGFQSMLIKTIENSQSSIAQQSRTKNSEARYSTAAQPKLSAFEAEASRASAEKVAAPRIFQHKNQTQGSAQQNAKLNQGEDHKFNTMGSQYSAQGLKVQDPSVNSVASILAIQSSKASPTLNVVEALDDHMHDNLNSSDSAKSLVNQMQDERLLKEAITYAKIQQPKSSSAHDDLTASETSTVILSEQSANKIISLSYEHPREQPKSAVNVAIQSYVGTEQWGREVRQKIVWMFGIGQQSATLTLNPPNLGPLHVSVKMQNNIAHTTFRTNDLTVRQALTDGLVQLSEMMSQRGLVLGKTTMTEIYQDELNSQM